MEKKVKIFTITFKKRYVWHTEGEIDIGESLMFKSDEFDSIHRG